jgi:hypothetical protein
LSVRFIKFQTRSGLRIEGEVVGDIGHALSIRVTKARKPFAGKTLVFAKNDILEAKAVAA